MRRLLVALLLALSTVGPAQAAAPEKWDTTVFSLVPEPGFPAYVHAHTNGRVYAGSYVDPDSSIRSRVWEWRADGTLLRSWPVPRQHLDEDHGVQVANQTRDGRLVLLETSTRSVRTLDVRTGRFRRVATFPEGAVPNYATWVPDGALLVTDYAAGVIWRVPPGGGRPTRWFESPALDGAAGFGTTGIRYRPGRRDLLITQQTVSDGSDAPTDGALYRLPVRADGSPGAIETLWTSQPGDLPDGFGIGRSGHVYVALAGLANQLVELTANGEEVARFPETPGSGESGSPVPFDTPCSATFRGTRVLVANQSAVAGDPAHQAILSVRVGERGRAAYLPRTARLRAWAHSRDSSTRG